MTIKVAIEHLTSYHFDRPVSLGPQVVRLRPAPHTRTAISAYSLRVEPADHFLNWQQDPFGNFEARLVFPERTTRLQVVVDLIAEMSAINPFDFFLDDDAETMPFSYHADLAADLAPYLAADEPGPLLAEWLDDVDRAPMRTIDFLVAVNQRLADDIEYTTRLEPGVQTPEETLHGLLGSCRDSAWLLVQILRQLGLAARFVSGYLVQLVADTVPLEGPAGPTADFTDLHAWAEVFLPGAGWVGLDPTSGLFAAEGHIPLAATPSPSTAAPISGLVDESEVELSFSNSVERVASDPRVTKPYRDDQWEAIQALGNQVDEHLKRGDVRLTMGGEPTFVSVDDMDAPEWTIAADGPSKRLAADDLMARLRSRFGTGGVLHHGQGKWYPGEPLPRWQQALIWRTDGVAIWNDPSLLADPDQEGSADVTCAERFVRRLACEIGLPTETVLAAWEDPVHELWQEALLPEGRPPADDVDPLDPLLGEQRNRRALLERIERRASHPVGWLLPLHRAHPGTGWASSTWTTRRNRLFLIPGDSPIGYRLPIGSLAWSESPPIFEPSPFSPLRPFPSHNLPSRELSSPDLPSCELSSRDLAQALTSHPAVDPAVDPVADPVADPAVHPALVHGLKTDRPPTALCAEIRSGRLHIFLPPVEEAADAIELLCAIERTAAALDLPVVIEGYPLPGDARLQQLVVAPDPGVIEVNVPPATDWPELNRIFNGVYDDARAVGLGTEKFDLDGTHSGTGGGNHVTIGGTTPTDSPLLRRPDLLRSLITYWQHHPALSYVFSGRFIGPSSQAPRVDEARDDNLYELETSFAELDRIDEGSAPWLVDRLLRHLLVDQTGNTHRSEFCIDKMFSPEGERGRLGLLELRAFEMPPHFQMAMVQALLVRALVARCWENPYRHDLVRWGTALHDRYLLPWFLERDLHDIARDLRANGFGVDPGWFDPFIEFRFPRHGSVTVEDLTLELRGAIEPWHVLGEEVASGAMARYVDSSTERLQLLVTGGVDGRHVVTCNGVEVPLTATDVTGTRVAGVRYKAWQPSSGLHPTIGIDSPLTFDVIDTWSERSLGGCRYHVVHPGGLSFESFPVNATVAESRRRTRFEASGHSPGSMIPLTGRPVQHREYPCTLDLRRMTRS